MLTHIHIRDFAIIDELEISFESGMSVLTGETGAGKSILVDALGLVLGDRADSDSVRNGANRAELSIILDISGVPLAAQWLHENDLGTQSECLMRRVVTREGRSRAYINGTPVTLNMAKTLGELLVDIHGQHEHQSLVRLTDQRRLLDSHANNENRLIRLLELFRQWQTTRNRLDALRSEDRERQARTDLLRYQIHELSELELSETEINEIENEQQRLAHCEQLLQGVEHVHATLYEDVDSNLYTALSRINHSLDELRRMDSSLSEFWQLLDGALVQIQEAANGLRRYADTLESDPARLAWIETRLASIHELARKHRLKSTQLPEHLTRLEAELAELEGPEFDLEHLQAQVGQIEAQYREVAHEVRTARIETAKRLTRAVTTVMQDLGMQGGRFEISIIPTDSKVPAPTGLDRVEFMVSPNPGQPLKPLAKFASGGELSRISLAIQVVAAQSLHIPTLVFDEVDAGIGGAVAESVGRRLRSLGSTRQVLCVTHLPQVAAQAHHHYQVKKVTRKKNTLTQIASLRSQERVAEVARMLGGLEMTEQTHAHAQEMINQAQSL